MKSPTRCILSAVMLLAFSTPAFAAIPPLSSIDDPAPPSNMDDVPPPPSELPPGEEPLGVPVEPSDVAEDVANRPTGSAPAPAGGNTPTTAAGTDNRHTTKPTGDAASPNQTDTNTLAKDVKSGNEPNKPGGPPLGTDNRHTTKPTGDPASPNQADGNPPGSNQAAHDAKAANNDPTKAADSGKPGEQSPGTDNRHTTKPTGDQPTPNQPDTNAGSKADTPAANNPGKQGKKSADGAKPGPNGKTPAGGNSKKSEGGPTGGNSKKSDGGPTGGNSKKSGGDKSGGKNGNSGAEDFPPLSPLDDSMDPEFEPAGAPRLPSKCADDSDCLPCFNEATAAMDKQRINLEKLRSIYDYTHKFTREGTEFLSAAGAAGGGLAQLGAAVEIKKVGGALDSFDLKVKNKSTELLGNLDVAVKQMAQCEADYMDDDTWYVHHGQVYLQFMKGHYSF